MMDYNTIINDDCLHAMQGLEENSIDLIVTDPPYNIGKAKWDKIDNYVEWMGAVFLECQRVLKDNGSFYWFHNDMPQIIKLMLWLEQHTEFVFKQFIVWNKRFENAKNKGFLDGFVVVDGLRNYQQMAEYCLFYTFQNNFTTLRQYFKDYQEALGLNKKEIMDVIGQSADHCFRWGSSQWDMPTAETYAEIGTLPIKDKFLRREYEDLRREYEDLRYTFNNQKTHHSVWNYEIESGVHPTQKPVKIIENIIRHSSNVGDVVLDPFLGSGTTAVACLKNGRQYLGIEKDPDYVNIAYHRTKGALKEMGKEAK